MKAIRLYALALCLVLVFAASAGTPPALAQTEETYVPHKMMWAAKRANVRAGPSTDNVKVDILEVGERVTVVGKVGDWFQLRHRPGQARRFVYAPLVTAVIPSTSKRSTAQSAASVSTVKTINFSNGDRYHGQIRDGKRNGRGVYMWANGNRYEGDFVRGKRTGRGILTGANGYRYEGDFVDGKQSGRGISHYADGGRYEGEFRDGKKHGQGLMTYARGDSRNGQWRNGKLNGPSTYLWADGDIHHDEWLDGERQRYIHRPKSTCLTVLRENNTFAYWINRCSVGIDVVWHDEGACRSVSGNKYPCSWFVGAGKKVSAAIEGHVWWQECESPGGLGDVLAVEKNGGNVYCMDGVGSQSLTRIKDERSTTLQVTQRAEADWEAEWARWQRKWDREEAEWEQEQRKRESARRKAESWNRIVNSLTNSLNTLQMLRDKGRGNERSGGYSGPDGYCSRAGNMIEIHPSCRNR